MAVGSVHDVQLLGLNSAAHVAQLGSQVPQVLLTKSPLGQTQALHTKVAGGAHEVHTVALLQVRQVGLQASQRPLEFWNVPFGQAQVPFISTRPGGQLVQPVGFWPLTQVRQAGSQAAQKPLGVNTKSGFMQLQLIVTGL